MIVGQSNLKDCGLARPANLGRPKIAEAGRHLKGYDRNQKGCKHGEKVSMKRIWKTKGGKRYKIREMGTQHIKNCIALLERYDKHRIFQAESWGTCLKGEQAIYAHEAMMRGLYDYGFEDEVDDYIFSFQQELERRQPSKKWSNNAQPFSPEALLKAKKYWDRRASKKVPLKFRWL